MLTRAVRAFLDAYRGLPRDVWILAGATFVNRSGTMVLPFLALYLMKECAVSAGEAGPILSCYGFGAIVGSLAGGVLSDRIGAKRVLILSLFGGGIGFFVLGQLREPLAIAASLFALGSVYEMLRPANGASLANATPPELRTRAMALNRVGVNLGQGFGIVLGGQLAEHAYGLLFIVDGATSVVAAGFLWVALGRGGDGSGSGSGSGSGKPALGPPVPMLESHGPSIPVPSPFQDRIFLILLVLMLPTCLVFFQGDTAMTPYLNMIYGLKERTIGWVFAVNMLLIVTLEMVLVHRLQSRAPLRVAAAGVFFTGVGFFLLPFGRTAVYAVLPVIIFTIGEMMTASFVSGFVATRGTARNRGRFQGLYLFLWAISFSIAPTLWLGLYDHVVPEAPFYVAGVLGVVLPLGFLALARMDERDRASRGASIS